MFAGSHTHVEKQGLLTKQGGSRGGWKTWRKRWFVLDNRSLRYFSNEKEYQANAPPLGKMSLSDLLAKALFQPLELQFRTSERVISVRAATEEIKREWVEAVTQAISRFHQLEEEVVSLSPTSQSFVLGGGAPNPSFSLSPSHSPDHHLSTSPLLADSQPHSLSHSHSHSHTPPPTSPHSYSHSPSPALRHLPLSSSSSPGRHSYLTRNLSSHELHGLEAADMSPPPGVEVTTDGPKHAPPPPPPPEETFDERRVSVVIDDDDDYVPPPPSCESFSHSVPPPPSDLPPSPQVMPKAPSDLFPEEDLYSTETLPFTQTDIEAKGYRRTTLSPQTSGGSLGRSSAVSSLHRMSTAMRHHTFKIERLAVLLEHLTKPSNFDNDFRSCFILFHRAFVSSEEFLSCLVERFQMAEDTSPTVAMCHATRARVVQVIDEWVRECFHLDFTREMVIQLGNFLSVAEHQHRDDTSLGKQIRKTHEHARAAEQRPRPNLNAAPPPPQQFGSMDSLSHDRFAFNTSMATYKSLPIAQALCHYDSRTFKKIHAREFYKKAWSKPATRYGESPNIMELIDGFNRTSFWVATEVLQQEELEQRAAMIKKFIKVAAHLENLCHFHAAFSVLSGVNNGAIRRMKDAWDQVPSKTLKLLDRIEKSLSTLRNFAEHRKIYRASLGKPSIPHMAVVCKDIFALCDLDTWDDARDKVNWDKFRRQYKILGDLQHCQRLSFHFKEDPVLRVALEKSQEMVLGEEDLFKLSYKYFPVGTKWPPENQSKWAMLRKEMSLTNLTPSIGSTRDV